MKPNVWMIRAGEGGKLIELFARGIVAVGWAETGPLTDPTQRHLRLRLAEVYPTFKPGTNQNAASVLWRFSKVIRVGDVVVTYDPQLREYRIGEITGEYRFDASEHPEYPHIRAVQWQQRASRDAISVDARNSLGSTLTLFAVSEETYDELKRATTAKSEPAEADDLIDEKQQLEQSNRDAEEQAIELIEDRILLLEPLELQELIAAILRAMGYRTRVSPPGPDHGVDVFASPDGLGLEEPRIKVEVKHRPKTAMGSQEIRSFLGGLRAGDRALYVSTGGFSKDAKYEAERAINPITLINLRELARLTTDNYDRFDPEGRALIPLKRIFRPID